MTGVQEIVGQPTDGFCVTDIIMIVSSFSELRYLQVLGTV